MTQRYWLVNVTPKEKPLVCLCVSLCIVCGHLYSSPVPSCDRLGLSLSTRYTVTRLPQGTILRVFFTFFRSHNVSLFGYETGENCYLWLPVIVMLHASPALHKLTKQDVKICHNLKSYSSKKNYLKKVVEPPEPYSRTSK